MAVIFPAKKNLTDLCDILGPPTNEDAYGHKASGNTPVAQGVACRLVPGRRGGTEPKSTVKNPMSDYFVYMMPISNVTLNEHHWLLVNGARYNIIEVGPEVVVGLPLEIRVERIKT